MSDKLDNSGCLWGLLFGWWGVLFEAIFGSGSSTKNAVGGAILGGLLGINDVFSEDEDTEA